MLQKFEWTSVKIVLLQYNSNFSYSSGLYVQDRNTEKSFKQLFIIKVRFKEKIFLIINFFNDQSLSKATNAYRNQCTNMSF